MSRLQHHPRSVFLVLIGTILSASCATSDTGVRRDAGSETVDGAAARDAGRSDAPTGDAAGCVIDEVSVERVRPAVLVLFDRSCSMRRRVDDPSSFAASSSDPSGRWAVARDAVFELVSEHATLDWGIASFPNVLEGCGTMPSIAVEPGPATLEPIAAHLSSVAPFDVCGVPPSTGPQPLETPTAEALSAARTWASARAARGDRAPRFVVLFTDGGATCGATPASLAAAVSELRGEEALLGAIGFGNEFDATVADARAMLDAMGSAGGLGARVATDAAGLAAVFGEIAARAAEASCRLELERPVAASEREYLRVVVDGVEVPESSENGWTLDADTGELVLHGSACPSLDDVPVSITTLCSPE